MAEFAQCAGCREVGKRRSEIEKSEAMQAMKGLQITLRRNPELNGEVANGEVQES